MQQEVVSALLDPPQWRLHLSGAAVNICAVFDKINQPLFPPGHHRGMNNNRKPDKTLIRTNQQLCMNSQTQMLHFKCKQFRYVSAWVSIIGFLYCEEPMATSVFCFFRVFLNTALEPKAFISKTSCQVVARWEQRNCYMMRLINFKYT